MNRRKATFSNRGDNLLFEEGVHAEKVKKGEKSPVSPVSWKIMIIDDDEAVHQVTRLVLEDLVFAGSPVELIHGYSGEDCEKLIEEHDDTAVLLLDVVMESDDAGLKVVKYIRNVLHNNFVRIILRTGQPGHAPEHEVITKFDINDYREKTELTAQKLVTSITAALRAYSDLRKIVYLAESNLNLEQRVRERTVEIMKINEELKGEVIERDKAYKKLQESEAGLHEAQRIARIGNWEWNIESNEFIWSDQACKILRGKSVSACKSFDDVLSAVFVEDRGKVETAFERALKDLLIYEFEHRILRLDGQIRYVSQQGRIERNGDGRAVRVVGTFQDITQRYQTEAQMRKLSGAVEQIAEAVMITDQKGVIEYVNPAFEAMTGYNRDEIIGKTPKLINSGKHNPAFYHRLWQTILAGGVFSDIILNRRKNGELFYEEKTITPQKNSLGEIVNFISSGKDVTERIDAQERISHMAHHDALTGLPNRVLLQDRLTQAMARGRWRDRNIAVVFIDLDRFKVINDTLGHDAGDELLKLVADRLQSCIREGDTVARLGGDEFAIVLNDVASTTDVTPVVDKILTSLRAPMKVNQQELFITPSMGISLFPNDGKDCQELLKKADRAMYRAKAKGKDSYQYYTEDIDSHSLARLSMETCLRKALEKNEFRLYYQPQVNIKKNQIVGFEALLRWRNDDYKNVSPMIFVPILEETGMIGAVGEWVLHTACRQQKEWLGVGLGLTRVAVNISIRQFKSQFLVQRIDDIIRDSGLEPSQLELELTEGLLIENIEETNRLLHALHEMGVSLTIDDFGTGYSSMNYLKRLPLDVLKIDRSFVKDIIFNPDDAAIASAIISLGHTLGMEIVAEGVETREQLRYLKDQDCDAIQGYLYSPPLEPAAITELVKDTGLSIDLSQGGQAPGR